MGFLLSHWHCILPLGIVFVVYLFWGKSGKTKSAEMDSDRGEINFAKHTLKPFDIKYKTEEIKMEKTTLQVEGMSCEHCVKAITKALNSLSSVTEVSVDLTKKTVAFEYDSNLCTIDTIKAEIEDQGYEVV